MREELGMVSIAGVLVVLVIVALIWNNRKESAGWVLPDVVSEAPEDEGLIAGFTMKELFPGS